MDTLRAKYNTQMREYDRLIATGNVTSLPRIRQLNASIGKLLDQMITQLTFLKKSTPSIRTERDKLVKQLDRIQREYNELAANRDELETLRRIRMEEGGEATKMLYRYLLAFFVACAGLILLLFFMSQRNEITAPIASTPPMTAALV
jgi:hypothetical protein